MATLRLPTGDRQRTSAVWVSPARWSRSSPPADRDGSGRTPTSGSNTGARVSASCRISRRTARSRPDTSCSTPLDSSSRPRRRSRCSSTCSGDRSSAAAKLAFQADPSTAAGVTSSSSRSSRCRKASPELSLAPGLKVNLKGKTAALGERARRSARRRSSRPRHAGGWHRVDLLGNRRKSYVCAQPAADRAPARRPVSVGCTGSPTQTDGIVTVTQTTSTTTTTTTTTRFRSWSPGPIGTSPRARAWRRRPCISFLFATPPSGGVPPYTLSWDFGDGAAGRGEPSWHTPTPNTGNFTATATATDSKATAVKTTLPVVGPQRDRTMERDLRRHRSEAGSRSISFRTRRP